jgi:hypothetical protein
MGIYSDTSTILGIRILIQAPELNGDYFVKHEFSGDRWKERAARVLPYFINLKEVKLQTLHPFSTSHDLYTGEERTPGSLWFDNHYFKLDDLLK